MNKRILIVVLVVLIGGAAVYGLTSNKKDNNQTNPASSTSQPANNTQAKSAAESTSSVSIANFAFMPGDITVKKGTTVTWTNNDSTPHTVTEIDGQTGPKSGNLNSSDKYTFTFDKAGTYHYHCDIHSSMLGTVTVTE